MCMNCSDTMRRSRFHQTALCVQILRGEISRHEEEGGVAAEFSPSLCVECVSRQQRTPLPPLHQHNVSTASAQLALHRVTPNTQYRHGGLLPQAQYFYHYGPMGHMTKMSAGARPCDQQYAAIRCAWRGSQRPPNKEIPTSCPPVEYRGTMRHIK